MKRFIFALLLVLIPAVTFAQVIFPNRGGTGVSSAPGANQLLIGNGSTYDLKTLTAGSNVTIDTTGSTVAISASLEGGGVATTDIDTYSELNAIVADVTLTHNGLFDTEAELEAILTNVTNLYTNNDGALADDDLSDNDTDDLSEGLTNLYFTNARVSSYLTGGIGITESSGAITFDCSEVEGTGINCTGEAITLDATGNWTGTLDGYEAAALLDDTTLTEEQVEDFVGGMLGGTETLISVTYQDATGDIDFVVNDSLSNFTNDAGFITSANDTVSGTELDGVFSTTGLLRRTAANTYSTITDNSSNWDTAFGWGDHSAAGYLTTVTATDMASADFGDFTCNGTVCTLDASYLTGNETITLSGDVSGSGATSIAVTVAANAIEESMFKVVDTPSDEECLTYETTTGDFEWQTCGSGSGLAEADIDTEAELTAILTDVTNLFTNNDTIDISDNTNLAAGTGITLTGDTLSADLGTSIDTTEIDADTITHADIADADQATTKCVYFEDPTADDDFQSLWANKTANDFLITEIWAESDQTVAFDLQIDDGTPADVNGTDITPAAGEAEDTSLSGDTTLAAGEELDLAITSVTNTPTWVSICWTGNWVD